MQERDEEVAPSFLERIAAAMDLPEDIVLDLPRLLVLGHLKLRIENHRGIIDFEPDRLTIGTRTGHLQLQGERLQIESMDPESLTVTGVITDISFHLAEDEPSGF